MRAKLYSRQKTIKGVDLSFDQEITIGRGRQNKVVLDKNEVSKKHLRIFFDENQKCFILEDFGSANGTHLDNIRVDGKEQLRHLNVISIAGLYDFIFQDSHLCKNRHPNLKQRESTLKQQPQTIVQQGAFVLPPELGKTKEAVGDHSKTVVAEGPFTLPPELGKTQEKSRPDQPETVVGESAFVLPPELGKTKEASISDHSKTVVGESAFALPPELGKVKEDKAETVFPESRLETIQLNKADSHLPQKPPPSRQRLFLEICIDGTLKRQFPLKEGENIVGRKAPAHIIIEQKEVSRQHAILTLKNRSVYLKDSGSKNKTFVDGEEINEILEIQPRHELRFGLIKARVVAE